MNHKEQFLIEAVDIEDKKELLERAVEIIDEQEEELSEVTQHAHILEIILIIMSAICVYILLKPFIKGFL